MAHHLELREIGPPLDENIPSFDIVFIHCIFASSDDLAATSSRWVKAIREITPRNACILSFDPKCGQAEEFSWPKLLGNSLDLLEALHQRRVKASFGSLRLCPQPRPIIFCCHSLGGIILKQTLWRVNQQLYRFRDLSDSLLGIVFLGTPHITATNERASQAFSRILRSDPRSPSKRTVSQKDLSSLAVVGLQFEELNLQIPILSAYETLETKLSAPLWFSKKAVLVDKELAKTGSPLEQLVPINVELKRIFEANPNNLILLDISDFVREIDDTSSRRIKMAAQSKGNSTPNPMFTAPPSSVGSEEYQGGGNPNNRLTPASFPAGSPSSEQSGSSWDFVQRALKPVNLPCHITKPHVQNPDFQGRGAALKVLDDALLPRPISEVTPAAAQLQVFALSGLGGVGKTQTALEFVFSRKHHFDAIFWTNSSSESKLQSDFTAISIQLGLETLDVAKDATASRELVKSWLAEPMVNILEGDPFQTRKAKWLLIFDNADDINVLRDFWPHGGIGSVLLTSRDALVIGDYYFNYVGMTLEPFTSDEAVGLLEHLTQQRGHSDVAQLIVDRFDRFPLAVSQMAGYIRRRSLSLAEFWDICNQKNEIPDLHQAKIGPHRGSEHTLATIWALEGLGQGAATILSISSLLDPDGIQEEILTTKPEEAQPLLLPISKSLYHKDLAELIQSSLVRRAVERKELIIHRLVQEVIRMKMNVSPGVLWTAFNATVNLLSSVWPFATTPHAGGYPTYNRIDRWNQCNKILPHISHLRQVFVTFELSNEPRATYYALVLLLSEAAWYQFERSNFNDSSNYVKAAFSICESTSENLKPLLADLHGTKQAIAAECNDAAGCFYHGQEQLTLQEELYAERGQLTSKLGIAHSQMGVAYLLNGLYHKAIESFQRSRSCRERMPGYSKLSLFSPLIGHGWALWLQGRHDESMELLLEALRDREAAFGLDDREGERTGQLLYALGNVRCSQGKLYESFGYHQRALAQYMSTIGDSHHYTADACFKVGEHYMRFENHQGARELFLQSITIYNNSSGKFFHSEIARSNFMLGKLLSLMGDSLGAQRSFDKALEWRRSVVPEDLRPIEELVKDDFQTFVTYWSK